MEDVIGFGEPSRRAMTRNSNWFCRFTTTPVEGGAEIRVEALRGFHFEDGSTEVTLHVTTRERPRRGSRVMIGHRLVKVDQVRREGGSWMVRDADTGSWLKWRGR